MRPGIIVDRGLRTGVDVAGRTVKRTFPEADEVPPSAAVARRESGALREAAGSGRTPIIVRRYPWGCTTGPPPVAGSLRRQRSRPAWGTQCHVAVVFRLVTLE